MKFIKYTYKYIKEGMQTSMGDNPAGEEFNMSPSTNHVSQQTDLKQINPDYQDEDDEDKWNPSIINKGAVKSGNVAFVGKKKTPGGGIDSFGNRKNQYQTDFATNEGFEKYKNLHKVNESTIGIKTEGSFKPKDLSDALDKAKVKFNMNRLSMTLTVLKLDKKYFDAAQKVVDDLGLNIMMANESVNEDVSNYSLLDFFKEMQSFPAAGVDRDDIKDASKPKNKKKTVKNTPALKGLLDEWMSGRYDEDPGYLVDGLRDLLESESVNEGSQEDVKDMHFEIDPKKLQQKIIALGKSMGALHNKEAKEFGEYSLHKYRKEIGYANKPDKKYKVDRDKQGYEMSINAFVPGSYSSAKSKLGDGPHRKARAKVKWNQKKYDQWIEDVSSGGGYNHAHDMAQNAKQEQGLIDWVKKNIVYDEDPMDRIQWDIEAQTP